MSFVRTVLGDIPAAQLGVCYAHEHIIIDPSFTTLQNPDFMLDDVAVAVAELGDFRRAGGRAMVDSMPCDCGRNVTKLAAISRLADVHIVAPTGLHLAKYYEPSHWGNSCSETELAALFIAEIETGIAVEDYANPASRRPTSHRAGVIKIATGQKISLREERLFAAAAVAQRKTGCPILTHTEQGALALEQIELLRRHGADLRHVCLSHTDRKPDVAYHREILASGVKVEFDSAFRWKPGQGNPTLDLVVALMEEFPTQIMLGMDAARRGYWRHYGGGPGLDFLLTTFAGNLKERGVMDAVLAGIFTGNPAGTFQFCPGTEKS
ncbi:MAG: aryldialkylphosphatase [Verrucomicrobia bacterium]|nr:aryldialkylphosphatase [Verrucomicrobiota bacterium]